MKKLLVAKEIILDLLFGLLSVPFDVYRYLKLHGELNRAFYRLSDEDKKKLLEFAKKEQI